MAPKQTSEELRKKAREMIKKAEMIERSHYLKIGEKAVELWQANKPIPEELKLEISKHFKIKTPQKMPDSNQ